MSREPTIKMGLFGLGALVCLLSYIYLPPGEWQIHIQAVGGMFGLIGLFGRFHVEVIPPTDRGGTLEHERIHAEMEKEVKRDARIKVGKLSKHD